MDDNEINLSVSGNMVESLCGVKCDLALSGEEAVELVKSRLSTVEPPYDIIFMDNMMPQTDGIETAKQLRKLGGCSAVPIIVHTGDSASEFESEFKSGLFNDFLAKPIEKEPLLLILKKWLSLGEGFNEIASDSSQVLFIFAHKAPVILDEMEKCLEAGDIKGFTIRVHGIKSSLAVIGAAALSKSAFELELLGKNMQGENCRREFPNFKAQVEKLILELPIKQKNKRTQTILPDKDFYERLEKIEKMHKDFDIEGYTRETRLLSEQSYREEINEKINHLLVLVETFDYRGICEFLATHLPSNAL
ncbi:MAG: response regulator [Oscillospiraceae bacterium]|nr:response regulator [Oscillospiraceae bacterium]